MDKMQWLVRYNEWWKTKGVRKDLKKEVHRPLYDEILKYIDDRQMIAITGLRRTGKSTVLYQIIAHLLEKGVAPNDIMYFSFDEESGEDPKILESLIEIFKNDMAGKNERIYMFFDEIQYIKRWQGVLKRYYDLYPNIKFYISGSASLNIKKAKESLAGRMYEFVLNPMEFKEFLTVKGIVVKEGKWKDIEDFKDRQADLMKNKDDILGYLDEYMWKGGFIELVPEQSLEKVKMYLRSNVEKVVFQDIPKAFKVDDPGVLFELLKIAASNSGNITNYDTVANAVGISRQTVSKYYGYLQQSFLLRMLGNHTGSTLAGTRKAKKFYLADHGIMNMLLDAEDKILSEQYGGKVMENILVNRTGSKMFWRKRYEVDIVLKDKVLLPIEVKYRNDPRDLKGLEEFMKKYGAQKGMVITKDLLDRTVSSGKEILFVPAWLYLCAGL